MTQLLPQIKSLLDREIVDKTGITGYFDFELDWTAPTPAGDTATALSQSDEIAALLSALKTQLGMNVKSTKGPVEVIVVEHAEKPSDN